MSILLQHPWGPYDFTKTREPRTSSNPPSSAPLRPAPPLLAEAPAWRSKSRTSNSKRTSNAAIRTSGVLSISMAETMSTWCTQWMGTKRRSASNALSRRCGSESFNSFTRTSPRSAFGVKAKASLTRQCCCGSQLKSSSKRFSLTTRALRLVNLETPQAGL